MRWQFSSAVLAAALVLGACTRPGYESGGGAARIDENQLREAADRVIATECTRLRGAAPSRGGDADYVLTVAPGGDVQRAELVKSFGDQTLDQRIGELLARLHLQTSGSGALRVRAGYACTATTAAATFDFIYAG